MRPRPHPERRADDDPGAVVEDVARSLVENRISGMPVCDAEGKVLGVISECDILFMECGGPLQRSVSLGWLLTSAPAPI